jgi:hypothetical protein
MISFSLPYSARKRTVPHPAPCRGSTGLTGVHPHAQLRATRHRSTPLLTWCVRMRHWMGRRYRRRLPLPRRKEELDEEQGAVRLMHGVMWVLGCEIRDECLAWAERQQVQTTDAAQIAKLRGVVHMLKRCTVAVTNARAPGLVETLELPKLPGVDVRCVTADMLSPSGTISAHSRSAVSFKHHLCTQQICCLLQAPSLHTADMLSPSSTISAISRHLMAHETAAGTCKGVHVSHHERL